MSPLRSTPTTQILFTVVYRCKLQQYTLAENKNVFLNSESFAASFF